MYSLNSVAMNSGPLSDVRLSGRPCLENIFSRLEVTFKATVDLVMYENLSGTILLLLCDV